MSNSNRTKNAPAPAGCPSRIPDSTRVVFLSSIDFIRNRLYPVEKNFRSAFEHVTWVREEVREVLEARDEANRVEEIGDVIMMGFRLSCFLHPERTSEEILRSYENHPTFRRYAEQIGFSGAKNMRAKFFGRYSFLDDEKVFREIFKDGEGQSAWQREIVRRMFGAEKSREPEKAKPVPPPSESSPSPETRAALGENGFREELEIRLAGWFLERMPGDAGDLFTAFRKSGRFADERFFRMAYLDSLATGDTPGALVRIALLAGTPEEREEALRFALPEADGEFVSDFLSEGPLSDRSEHLHYRESFAAYRLFLEAGFPHGEALEHASGLVASWRIFGEIESSYDFFQAVEEARKDGRFLETDDPSRKFVAIQAAVHSYRKRSGTYAKGRTFEKKVLDTLRPYFG